MSDVYSSLDAETRAGPGIRRVAARTRGRPTGPVIRLVSPDDLGERLKPFVFLDIADITPGPAGTLRWHPHSGIATVTTVLAGEAEYRETTGVHGRLGPGGVEWMAAGRGVWHTAAPVGENRLKGFQLWIALPPDRELQTPESRYLDASEIPKSGSARVILGTFGGVRSPINSPAEVTFLDVRLRGGETWIFDPPEQHVVLWIAPYRGAVEWDGGSSDAGELVAFDEGGAVTFRSPDGVGFVLGSAPRALNPLHIGNHSVHGSAEALEAGEKEIARLASELRRTGVLA